MKSIKLLGVLAVVGTSLVSFTPAFADEVTANGSSEQVTLQSIETENTVQYDAGHTIQPRKITYYANGLSCNSKTGKCSVNWGQAVTCQFNRWATNGNGKC